MTNIAPLTEQDIAEYLAQTPEFFERNADLLATVRLASPHGGRAISLQERQAEMLRDKIRMLERRLVEFMHYGNENMLLGTKLERWVRHLLLVPDAGQLPAVLLRGIQSQFDVPQAALRLWDLRSEYAHGPHAGAVDVEVRNFAEALEQPYCGINSGFEAAQWLQDPAAARSLVMLPLRIDGVTFGLLVLASPDAARYEATMATDFVERIAAVASAALVRLRAAASNPAAPAGGDPS